MTSFVLADFRRLRDPAGRARAEVPLGGSAPMAAEWVLLCLGRGHSACLVGRERPGPDRGDEDRIFDGLPQPRARGRPRGRPGRDADRRAARAGGRRRRQEPARRRRSTPIRSPSCGSRDRSPRGSSRARLRKSATSAVHIFCDILGTDCRDQRTPPTQEAISCQHFFSARSAPSRRPRSCSGTPSTKPSRSTAWTGTGPRTSTAELLEKSGGEERIAEYAAARDEEVDAAAVYETKSELFQRKPRRRRPGTRDGVAETVADGEARTASRSRWSPPPRARTSRRSAPAVKPAARPRRLRPRRRQIRGRRAEARRRRLRVRGRPARRGRRPTASRSRTTSTASAPPRPPGSPASPTRARTTPTTTSAPPTERVDGLSFDRAAGAGRG